MLKKIICKKNKGFTLIEVIVVLVIIGILLAIAIPSIMGYVNDAHEAKNDIKVGYLNKGTEAYKVRLYANNALKDDVFEGLDTDKKRQKALLDARMIDEYFTSYGDDSNYFYWDVKEQIWKKKPGTGGDGGDDKPVIKQEAIRGVMPVGTLADQILKDGIDINKVEDYNQYGADYKNGDYVKYNNILYKCVYDEGGKVIPGKPDSSGKWKVMDLAEFKINAWEAGDIIAQGGEFYMAYMPRVDKVNYYIQGNKQLSDIEYFVKIKKENGVWVEA